MRPELIATGGAITFPFRTLDVIMAALCLLQLLAGYQAVR